MRRIFLHKKTGFKVLNDQPINIRDSKGRLFYSTEYLQKNPRAFNLPSGIPLFVESGYFSQLPRPVKFKLKRLPARERIFKGSPKSFKVCYIDNPNKCSIDWKNKRIYFDHSFKERTIPENTFILYHEFGHQYYGTEHYADLYARNQMIKRGYNPSQIALAPFTTLSSRQDYRKDNIINSFE